MTSSQIFKSSLIKFYPFGIAYCSLPNNQDSNSSKSNGIDSHDIEERNTPNLTITIWKVLQSHGGVRSSSLGLTVQDEDVELIHQFQVLVAIPHNTEGHVVTRVLKDQDNLMTRGLNSVWAISIALSALNSVVHNVDQFTQSSFHDNGLTSDQLVGEGDQVVLPVGYDRNPFWSGQVGIDHANTEADKHAASDSQSDLGFDWHCEVQSTKDNVHDDDDNENNTLGRIVHFLGHNLSVT